MDTPRKETTTSAPSSDWAMTRKFAAQALTTLAKAWHFEEDVQLTAIRTDIIARIQDGTVNLDDWDAYIVVAMPQLSAQPLGEPTAKVTAAFMIAQGLIYLAAEETAKAVALFTSAGVTAAEHHWNEEAEIIDKCISSVGNPGELWHGNGLYYEGIGANTHASQAYDLAYQYYLEYLLPEDAVNLQNGLKYLRLAEIFNGLLRLQGFTGIGVPEHLQVTIAGMLSLARTNLQGSPYLPRAEGLATALRQTDWWDSAMLMVNRGSN